DQLQASVDDDDSGAVSLAAVAEAPGSGPDRPVTVPFSAESDLQEAEPGTELPPLPEPELPLVEGTIPLPASVQVDLTVDDDPSEDEVIEGGLGPNTGRFRVDGEEVAAEAVLLDVTGPMPTGGGQAAHDDDDDDDDDDSPIVDQTTMFMTTPKVNPDVVPTLVEPPPYVRPAMDGPQQVESVFGFPHEEGEGTSDPAPLDAHLDGSVRGPTAVPIERQESPPQVAKPKGSLEFMSGTDRGKRIEVGDQIAVGQSRQCGVSIPSDLRLSPIHCRLERSRDGFVLTDEGSANGTVVNGQRVSRFPLHGGEVIMVGRTVLRFRLERA
ncbi:MAG: FHA domain-containing protein, partial [Myxococcota bacterium]